MAVMKRVPTIGRWHEPRANDARLKSIVPIVPIEVAYLRNVSQLNEEHITKTAVNNNYSAARRNSSGKKIKALK